MQLWGKMNNLFRNQHESSHWILSQIYLQVSSIGYSKMYEISFFIIARMEFVYYEQCGHILYIISLTIHVLSKASVGILWVPYQPNLRRNMCPMMDMPKKPAVY